MEAETLQLRSNSHRLVNNIFSSMSTDSVFGNCTLTLYAPTSGKLVALAHTAATGHKRNVPQADTTKYWRGSCSAI